MPLVGCSGVGFSSDPVSTPAPETTFPASTSAATTTTSSTTTSTSSTTLAQVAPVVATGPFPTEYEYGRCNPESIRQDFGVAPRGPLRCQGAWAITQINECPPETECEGVDIFRWTENGWTHRGFYYSLCVLEVDRSGLPRAINDQLLAGNKDCRTPIITVPESPTGNLTSGDVGERVRRLQLRLIDLRLLEDVADGRFGPNTGNAVIDFQFLVGLEPTAVVDDETATALGLV